MPETLLHKNKPLAVGVAVLLAVLLRLGNFFEPLPPSPHPGPLYALWQTAAWPPILLPIVALLVLALSATLLDMLISRFNLLGSISGYPVLFFAVFASLHPVMGSLSPGVAALPFVVAGIWAFMLNFGQKRGQFSALASGLAFSCAALLYSPFLILIPFGITALAVLKPASWREYTAQILGFGLPFGLFYSVLYLSNLPMPSSPSIGYMDLPAFFGGFSSSWGFWVAAGVCFITLNLSLLSTFNSYNTYKIITRRFFSIVILIPAFLIPASALPPLPDMDVWWPVAIPFAVLAGRFFMDIKKPSVARLLLVVLLLAALLARFDYYFAGGFTFKLVN